jgi:hypothetical protein
MPQPNADDVEEEEIGEPGKLCEIVSITLTRTS